MDITLPQRFMTGIKKNRPKENPGDRAGGAQTDPGRPILRMGSDVVFLRFAGRSEKELEALARQTSVKRQGYSTSGRIYFSVATEKEPLTSGEAQTIQRMIGYHPQGYSFFHLSSGKTEDGKYLNHWSCAASCD